jgi:hypothetical protein
MGKLFKLPLFFYSVRLVRTGKGGKEGENAILDEVLCLGKGKTLMGIINFHSILT